MSAQDSNLLNSQLSVQVNHHVVAVINESQSKNPQNPLDHSENQRNSPAASEHNQPVEHDQMLQVDHSERIEGADINRVILNSGIHFFESHEINFVKPRERMQGNEAPRDATGQLANGNFGQQPNFAVDLR